MQRHGIHWAPEGAVFFAGGSVGLNVTLSPSKLVVVPDVRYGLSWEQLVELLGVHRPYADKEHGVPMFSPAEWAPGQTVGKAGVAAIHFGVIDLDDTPEQDLLALLGALEYGYLYLTSWSHGSTDPQKLFEKANRGGRWGTLGDAEKAAWGAEAASRTRGRLVFPFTRPAVPSEWPVLWEALNRKVANGLGDTSTKDAGRRYWFPSHPVDPGKPPARFARAGPPVDLDAILGDQAARAPWIADDAVAGLVGGGLEVSRDQVRTIARRLNASPEAGRKAVGQALYALLRGDEYAEHGQRHNVTYRMVCEIVDRHPLAAVEKLADLFAPSLAMMTTSTTREDIVKMIEGKQAGARALHGQRIEAALGGDRTTPYTEEETDVMVDALGTTHTRLRQEWIIQKDNTFYVLCDGRYRRYTGKDVTGGALRDLAPAISSGVDLFTVTQKGQRLKTPLELVRDYGNVAEGIIVDMVAQRASYDAATRTFTEAPCPLRLIPAVFHEGVDRWLRLLGGKSADRLMYWLACLPKLDEPCAALYLEGAPRTGKTLLACAAARFWTTERPTELDEVLANFNEALAKCPLVFGDETVPKDARGQMRTPEIRELVQARQRPLKRKNLPNSTLRGCVRMILAANNKGLLQTHEQLTEHDIEALVERFFYLRVGEEAAAYLADVGPLETKRWLEEDLITGHFMWLHENLEVPRTGRFLVSGVSSDLAAELATSTGHRAQVCQWLAGYLLDPKKFTTRPGAVGLMRVKGGRLLATSRAIHDTFDLYVNERAPTLSQITKALAGLSAEITMREANGNNRKYRNVRLDLLVSWAAANSGYLDDTAAIDSALGKLDEDTTPPPPPPPPPPMN